MKKCFFLFPSENKSNNIPKDIEDGSLAAAKLQGMRKLQPNEGVFDFLDKMLTCPSRKSSGNKALSDFDKLGNDPIKSFSFIEQRKDPLAGFMPQPAEGDKEKARRAAQDSFFEWIQADMQRQQAEADRKNGLIFQGNLIDYASNAGQGGSSTEGIDDMAFDPFAPLTYSIKKARGGRLYDGTTEPTQQMQKGDNVLSRMKDSQTGEIGDVLGIYPSGSYRVRFPSGEKSMVLELPEVEVTGSADKAWQKGLFNYYRQYLPENYSIRDVDNFIRGMGYDPDMIRAKGQLAKLSEPGLEDVSPEFYLLTGGKGLVNTLSRQAPSILGQSLNSQLAAANAPTTARALGKGIMDLAAMEAGNEVGNMLTRGFTPYDSWGEYVSNVTPLPRWAADLSNPFALTGPALMEKGASALYNAGEKALEGVVDLLAKQGNNYARARQLSRAVDDAVGSTRLSVSEPTFATAKEPMMGYRDPVCNDMFVYRNTKEIPDATAIIGHDQVTEDFPYTSNGTEILSLSPNNVYPLHKEPPTISWSEAINNPTNNLLKWLGRPTNYRPKVSLLDTNGRAGITGSAEEKLMNIFDLKGIDLSRLSMDDLAEAIRLREKEITSSAPERYTIAKADNTDLPRYTLLDYYGDNKVGRTIVQFEDDGNVHIGMTRNLSQGTETPVHQVEERGLNSSINLANTFGGEGVVSGKQYLSASRQYPVVQKFRDRVVIGNTGDHNNLNMNSSWLHIEQIPEMSTMRKMLSMRRAGSNYPAVAQNMPIWLLKKPTFLTQTKSNLFDPAIIDSSGKMNIEWLNPNVLRGIIYPTLGETLLNNYIGNK